MQRVVSRCFTYPASLALSGCLVQRGRRLLPAFPKISTSGPSSKRSLVTKNRQMRFMRNERDRDSGSSSSSSSSDSDDESETEADNDESDELKQAIKREKLTLKRFQERNNISSEHAITEGRTSVVGGPGARYIDLRTLPDSVGYRLNPQYQRLGHADDRYIPSSMLSQLENLDAGSVSNNLCWNRLPRTILIVKRLNTPLATLALDAIARWLDSEYGVSVLVEPHCAHEHPLFETYDVKEKHLLANCVDLVLCLGGDGTILYACTQFEERVPPVMAFSLGTLGFLTPFDVAEYKVSLTQLMQGGLYLSQRLRLACGFKMKEKNQDIVHHAMNEIVCHRGNTPQMLRLDVYVNGDFLTNAICDGMIVSTPTGSTAYSMSAGGAMVQPTVNSIILTPICPRSLSFRPIIISENCRVTMRVGRRSHECTAIVDGQRNVIMERGDTLTIAKSPYPLCTINRYDETLDWLLDVKDCLRWNEDLPSRSSKSIGTVSVDDYLF